MADMRWYVVHVYSGFEKKIAQQIQEQAAQKGLADQIGDIMAGLPPRPPKPLAQPPQQPPKHDAPGATTTTAPA